jgi:5-methyltetrahydropteroyltriglutamate--homocysteine methyltransferase
METQATVRTPRKIVRAEGVGSLLRPPRLKAMFDKVYGSLQTPSPRLLDEPGSGQLEELERLADSAVADAIRRQVEIGLDVITDGEMRRAMFTHSLVDALEGYEDNTKLVTFTNADGEELSPPAEPKFGSRRLRKVANPAAAEVRFARTLSSHPLKTTFPAMSFWYGDKIDLKLGVYESHDEFVAHLAELQGDLIEEVIEAGASYIQLDWPIYAVLADSRKAPRYAELFDETLDSLLGKAIAADNAILERIPDHVTTALHICRGNYRSAWFAEGPLDPVAERIFNELKYDRLLIEWEDPEREGDFSSLRFVPKNGPIVVLGLVSTKYPEVESVADVESRLEQAAEYLEVEQLALSPQCGFASCWEGNDLAESSQWRKLEVVVEVADRVWDSN